jgi:hypothetical protein
VRSSRVASVVALIAIALWLGGLLVLGALVAPVVFSIVALPSAADAMVVVFRRFDRVAMMCAAVLLSVEAFRAVAGAPTRFAVWRGAASAFAALAAVFQGLWASPHIAALHAQGAVRGLGPSGAELARWHDLAEWTGQLQVVLLVALIALQVAAVSEPSEGTG